MQSEEGEKVVIFPHLSGFPQIYKGHFFWSTHVRLISSQNGYFKKAVAPPKIILVLTSMALII